MDDKVKNTYAGDESEQGPLLSVIIAVYNAEPYLAEAMDSLLVQDFRDMEILCVNDGSTDKSGKILAYYAARDPRIRILDQENRGASAARNTGTHAAKGKYLYYMDSDDLLEPGALGLVIAEMEQGNLEYLCFNSVAFAETPEGQIMAGQMNRDYLERELEENRIYTGQALFRELKTNPKMDLIVPAWGCIITRDFILKHQILFVPGMIHEDEVWTFSVLMKVQRAGCLNRCLYYYRIHTDSQINGPVTLANAYNLYRCILEIQKIFAAPDFLCEPGLERILIKHTRGLQNRAIQKYLACSQAEKEKRYQLSLEEQSRFETLVVKPAAMKADLQRAKKQALAEKEKAAQYMQQNKQYKQYKQKNKLLKASRDYRLGRALLWLPRKIKRFLKAAASPGAAGSGGKGQAA